MSGFDAPYSPFGDPERVNAVMTLASRLARAATPPGSGVDANDVASETLLRLLKLAAKGGLEPPADIADRTWVTLMTTRAARWAFLDEVRKLPSWIDIDGPIRPDGPLISEAVGSSVEDPIRVLESREDLSEIVDGMERLLADACGRFGAEGELAVRLLRDEVKHEEIARQVNALRPDDPITRSAISQRVRGWKRDFPVLKPLLERRRPPDDPASRGGGRRGMTPERGRDRRLDNSASNHTSAPVDD